VLRLVLGRRELCSSEFPRAAERPEGANKAITITDTSMRSDKTGHAARHLRSDEGCQRWEVTWLPGRVLGRSEAITAMMLAQTVATGLEPGDRRWPFIDAWAEELELTGPDAVARASDSPAGRDWQESEPEAG
jgi:hypothetical protein